MEIERKFLIRELPQNLTSYPHHEIEQAYLNENPVIRIRKRDDDYILTYKSRGLMVRQELEVPLTREAYEHLLSKADGRIISKTRYLIPDGPYTVELDVFHGDLEPLLLAEVEFDSEEAAQDFPMPDWFEKDVTMDPAYHNVTMALHPKV